MASGNQLFLDGLSRLLGAERIARLGTAQVAIAGAGGLGSNCAVHLVRSGVLRLTLADFDRVEWSNLNRQHYFQDQIGRFKVEALAENLRRINPDVELELCYERLSPATVARFLAGADILVEAFDRAEAKVMLVETALAHGLPVVAASGLGGYGRGNRILGRIAGRRLCLVGDGISEVGESLAPWSPIVGIAAAKQADAVIQWLLEGKWTP